MVEYKITFEMVEFFVDALIDRLNTKGHKFDYVIGIGRGGLVPATLIGYRLNLPVLNYGINTYAGKSKLDKPDVYQDIDFSKLREHSNILVIDDIADTGDTFEHFYKLRKPNVGTVIYAALFAKEGGGDLQVHFYSSLASKNQWISFPWESK